MLLDFITLITFRQQYSSWRSSLCSLLYSLGTSPSYVQYRPILENPHRGNVPRDNMNSADTETGHFPHILATAIRKDLLYTASISWSLCVVTSCWRRHSRRTRNVGNTAVIYTIQDVTSYPESGALSMYLCGRVLYRMWRYIKEVALYQRGGSVSKKWCCTKELAPYTGGSAIWRGWRHIKEVAVYQRGGAIWRGGAISMRWRRMKGWGHIKEVALYQGHPVQTKLGQSYRLQFLLPLPPLRPARVTISPAAHHSVNTQYYKCDPEANRRTPSL
jgi:hypothetical protein